MACLCMTSASTSWPGGEGVQDLLLPCIHPAGEGGGVSDLVYIAGC